MFIDTERLTLRPFRAGDLPASVAYRSDGALIIGGYLAFIAAVLIVS